MFWLFKCLPYPLLPVLVIVTKRNSFVEVLTSSVKMYGILENIFIHEIDTADTGTVPHSKKALFGKYGYWYQIACLTFIWTPKGGGGEIGG